MAIDSTKLFTITGKYLKRMNDYFALIGTMNTDQETIEDVLVAQDVDRLIDGLDGMYDTNRTNIVGWVNSIILRLQSIWTDSVLVASQFPFGAPPSIQQALAAVIKYMAGNDLNVKASAMTTGSVTRSVVNSAAGTLAVGTVLDGVSPPMSGATANGAYLYVPSQMYPDDETVTFTCTQDSEHGGQRGGEQWAITGTGASSPPYSVDGENIGTAGSIRTSDYLAESFVPNSSLDSWTSDVPTGWTVESGTPVTDFEITDYGVSPGTLNSASLHGLRTHQTGNDLILSQLLQPAAFQRGKAYFLSCWAKKIVVAGIDPTSLHLRIFDTFDNSAWLINGGQVSDGNLNVYPTSSTAWQLFQGLFIVPQEIKGDIQLEIVGTLDAGDHETVIDQIVITPATYIAGAAFAIYGGADKFLQGDQLSVRLQNDCAGKFQTLFRKAWKVQLPTDATPTISDSLVV